tara:strand:- start:2316 stop:3554 length:1239 start_codon:yes stop_codon:yes gene_type:complete
MIRILRLLVIQRNAILCAGLFCLGFSAASMADEPTQVMTGIDVLQARQFAPLEGARVALITNHTGVDSNGRSTASILHAAPNVTLVALFSPEHGFKGQLDLPEIGNVTDSKTGMTVYSLYGETRTPTKEMLRGVDTIVFDIQDIGTRFYTYVSTMGNAMQAAAQYKLRFIVLDRPNPINGIIVSGPVLDEGKLSFVGFHRLPVRHGMTIGELARMFQNDLELDIALEVVPLQGWRRSQYFDATGLAWINPSPNMRSLNAAILYPGIGLLETTNLSVGRGTDAPFEWFGAPWLNARALAAALNSAAIDGAAFMPVTFTPTSSKFADQLCTGVRISITNRDRFDPVRLGLEIAHQLVRLHPDEWDNSAYNRLLGNDAVLDAVRQGRPLAELEETFGDGLDDFRKARSGFLLYPD